MDCRWAGETALLFTKWPDPVIARRLLSARMIAQPGKSLLEGAEGAGRSV
jgi:hypothetical protein